MKRRRGGISETVFSPYLRIAQYDWHFLIAKWVPPKSASRNSLDQVHTLIQYYRLKGKNYSIKPLKNSVLKEKTYSDLSFVIMLSSQVQNVQVIRI